MVAFILILQNLLIPGLHTEHDTGIAHILQFLKLIRCLIPKAVHAPVSADRLHKRQILMNEFRHTVKLLERQNEGICSLQPNPGKWNSITSEFFQVLNDFRLRRNRERSILIIGAELARVM